MALSFEQQIRRIIDNRAEVSQEIFTASCIQVSEKVITRTPVDEGRARGNWNASINSADDSTSDTRRASQAQSDARSTAGRLRLGDTFHLTNGLPYIRPLEYDRLSRQAPNGMVRITLDEFNAALREIVRRVS